MEPLPIEVGRLLNALSDNTKDSDKQDTDLVGSSEQENMDNDCGTGSAHFAVVLAAIGIPLLLLVAALCLFCRYNQGGGDSPYENSASDGATVSMEKDLEQGQDEEEDEHEHDVEGRLQNVQIDLTCTDLSFESSSSESTS